MLTATVLDAAWLFARGRESVRIVRRADADPGIELIVQGPGAASATERFRDIIQCMNRQMDLERRLVAEGFCLETHSADRRRLGERRRTDRGDRRRGA